MTTAALTDQLRALLPPEAAPFLPEVEPCAHPDHGDVGVPLHALSKLLRKSPVLIAQELALAWEEAHPPGSPGRGAVRAVRAVAGYVNFVLDPTARLSALIATADLAIPGEGTVLVEFSSPNTNKPQHLGHARNNFLGAAVANLLEAGGRAGRVLRVNLVNDRGIHICKSLLAWQLAGSPDPLSSGVKGDHLAGRYYVEFAGRFEAELLSTARTDRAEEVRDWAQAQGVPADRAPFLWIKAPGVAEDHFNSPSSPLGAAARAMLLAWEAGEEAHRADWSRWRTLVLQGFEQTYLRLGVRFDLTEYESETYLLGKAQAERALSEGRAHRWGSGAVMTHPEPAPGEPFPTEARVLLRADGSSLYLTQDLGTAVRRLRSWDLTEMIYVVGDEQCAHFEVLFRLLREGWAPGSEQTALHHLAYGMVKLPHGKMKSREGTVVDVDNLLDALRHQALEALSARRPHMERERAAQAAEAVGLASLKFHLLDHPARASLRFNPEEALSFTGRTGVYVLYTFARVTSALRKAEAPSQAAPWAWGAQGERACSREEAAVLTELEALPAVLRRAARDLDPSLLTSWLFRTCSVLNTLYTHPDHRLRGADPARAAALEALLTEALRRLRFAAELLGLPLLEEL